MLTVIPVLIPQCHSEVIIKEKIGKGSKQWDEEMTVDKDGESELSELLTTPQAPQAMGKKAVMNKAIRGVPKAAEVVVLDMPGMIPCK